MSEPALLALLVVVSAAVTWLARAYAVRGQLLDEPGGRRAHTAPTPRGGGLGPVVAIAIGFGIFATAAPAQITAILAGFLAVGTIGFLDDHRPLPASWRLLVHVVAGLLLAWSLFDPLQSPLEFVATLGGAIVLVNVWNFMDGIDGMATSQAALVAAAAAAMLAPSSQVLALVVVAACLGFLPFNFPRARIFLGDIGSGALGFGVAVVWSLSLAESAEGATRLALPASAFVIDATLTLGRRVLRRERWWEGHAQHLYQQLARRHGHPPVTAAYALWTMAAVTAAIVLPASPPLIAASVFVWYTTGAALWFLLQHKSQPDATRTPEKDR